MGTSGSKGWRQATVWMHVLTSVGWMGQAMALCVLMGVAMAADDAAVRHSALSMAHALDTALLAPLANASAFTGFVLSAATPWGLQRYWWVLTKFAITVVQLNLGVFVLSNALNGAAAAAAAGEPDPAPAGLLVGSVLMVGGIAFQAWLSIAKPGGRTSWTAGAGRVPVAPTWVFAAGTLVPVADTAVALWLGSPLPVLTVSTLVVVLVRRYRRGRRVEGGRPRPAESSVDVCAAPLGSSDRTVGTGPSPETARGRRGERERW